jgi:sugar phosphate isomerase/epimerase
MTDMSRPTAAYKELGEYGKSKGVKVLIENHGNVAGKAENIVAIVKGTGADWVGTLPTSAISPRPSVTRAWS